MRIGFLTFCVFTALIAPVTPAVAASVDYQPWARVLEAYVNDDGLVDYERLKENRAELDAFIKILEETDASALSGDALKAFWINAYNAITLTVVVDAYPVAGIRRINFGLVWQVGRSVARGKKSLGDIEHKILRPMGDPRIHFAINCASVGCPKLPTQPFYPEDLDEQLDQETRRFINDPDKVRVDKDSNMLLYSAIFSWFEEDFLAVAPDIRAYIIEYLNENDRRYIEANDVKLTVLPYDWNLNDQKKR